jgi:hypothetical protein
MCSVVMCVAAFILQLEAQHAQSHKSLKTSIHAISRLLGQNPATPGIPCLAILVWNGLCRQTAFCIAGSMIFQYFTKQTSNFILPIKLQSLSENENDRFMENHPIKLHFLF